jgi:hypothetical protein
MRNDPLPKAVVVGIDGSKEAILAATWAVDEAIARDVPLRLVYINPADSPGHGFRTAMAELALRVAAKSVAEQEKPRQGGNRVADGPRGEGLRGEGSDSRVAVCRRAVPGRGRHGAAGYHCVGFDGHGAHPARQMPGGDCVQAGDV